MTGKKEEASDMGLVYRCPGFEIRRLAPATAHDASDAPNSSLLSIVATNDSDDTTRGGTLSYVVKVDQASFLVAPAHIFMPHPPDDPEEEAYDSESDSGSELLRAGSATPPDFDSALSSSTGSEGIRNGVVQTAPSSMREDDSERPNSTPPSLDSDHFHIFSLEHDCALIAVSQGKTFYQELSYISPQNIQRIDPGQVSVSAATPLRGLMHGWLDGRSTLMRLPYSNKFSKLYPVNFTDPVREGDCGSLVIDQNTKQIYGFIVAASMEGRVAYVVSANEILQDITSKLGQECAGGHSISKEPSVPLHATSDKGSQAAINLLPGRTADVSSKDATVGATPLSWAAINGHVIVVKLLLENGADIESKDTVYGRTPISWAAMNGHTAIVRLLLGRGADIEAKDQPFSPTPLSLAAMNGHAAIVKMLLEAKADTESVAAYPVESNMQCDPPNPALTEIKSNKVQVKSVTARVRTRRS